MSFMVAACGGDGVTQTIGPEDRDESALVDSIYINPPERILGMLGLTGEFAAGAYAADGSSVYGLRTAPERFSWSSSDPSVATVDGPTVTSVGEGTTTVDVTVEDVTRSATVTVRDRARVAWSLPVPAGIGAGNVMGTDGTIYVGTNDWTTDSSVWYAVSPKGDLLWTLPLAYYTAGIPAIGSDGTLYFGSWFHDEGGRLIAVDPGGTVRWVLEDLDRVRASPAIGPDGTIYVPGHQYLYAIDPEGEIRWTYEHDTDVFLFSSPAIASDGTIYVGGDDGFLYAIDPDGSLQWTFKADDRIRASPSIGADGTIYFGSHGGLLFAVDPDGTERWSVPLRCGLPWGCMPVAAPSIGPDGTIYVLADGLFAVAPEGSIRWSAMVGRGNGGTPILGANGHIYVAGRAPPGRQGVYTLDSTGARLGDYPMAGAGGTPLIALDGTIIVAAGNEVVAIVEHESTNGGYEGAHWPTDRGDRANTGRAGG